MIIIRESPGNGWSWHSVYTGDVGLLEDSAGWEYLERMCRGGPSGRVSYPTHCKEALEKELSALGLDLGSVVLHLVHDEVMHLGLGS